MNRRSFWSILLGVLIFETVSHGQVLQPSIWDLISKHSNLTKFAQLVQDAKTTAILNDTIYCKGGTLCLTVLAPNNWAVDAILPDLKWTSLNDIQKVNIIQALIVQYSEPIYTNTWMNSGRDLNLMDIGFGTGRSLDTRMPSQRFAFQAKLTPSVTDYFVNNAVVVQPDLSASNGVVHITSELLFTTEEATPLTTFLSKASNLRISGELWIKLMDYNRYQPFVRQRILNQPLYATYFLVTDEGWRSVPTNQLDMLRNNITLLASVLTHHYCPNQLVFNDWMRRHPVINMYTGFPEDPSNPDTSQLNKASLRRSLDGTVTMRSANFQGTLTHESVVIENAVIHTITSPIGFVFRTAESIINEINREMLTACKADADCSSLLTSNGRLTFFVPSRDNFGAFLQLTASEKKVYLKFMVLKGELLQDQMTDVRMISINGLPDGMRFRHYGGSVYVEGRLVKQAYVSSRIIRGDLQAIDGVIHQIDRVPALPTETVSDFLARNSNFSSFKSYNFVEKMNVGGPYTYFVPTNMALKAMMDDVTVGRKLLSDPSRRDFVFRRHSYPLKLLISELSPSKRYLLSTANYAFTREELPMSIAVLNNNNKEAILNMGAKSMKVSTANGEYQCTNGVVYTTNVILYTVDDLTVNTCTSPGC